MNTRDDQKLKEVILIAKNSPKIFAEFFLARFSNLFGELEKKSFSELTLQERELVEEMWAFARNYNNKLANIRGRSYEAVSKV